MGNWGNGNDLWDSMNARVGNPSAAPIDPRLVPQAVGHFPGVVPTATGTPWQQQYTGQGERALILHLAVYLMPIQGLNPAHR